MIPCTQIAYKVGSLKRIKPYSIRVSVALELLNSTSQYPSCTSWLVNIYFITSHIGEFSDWIEFFDIEIVRIFVAACCCEGHTHLLHR